MPSWSAVHVKAVVHGPWRGRQARQPADAGGASSRVALAGVRYHRSARIGRAASWGFVIVVECVLRLVLPKLPWCVVPGVPDRCDCAAAALPPCCHRGFICVASGADPPQDRNTAEFRRRRKAGCLVSFAIPGCTLDIVGGVIGVSFLLSASQERALDG